MNITSIIHKLITPPTAKKCFHCPVLRPLYTLDKDIADFGSGISKIKLLLHNGETNSCNFKDIEIDLKKPAQIILDEYVSISKSKHKPMTVTYNPDCNTTIFLKERNKQTGKFTKKPFEINIMQSYDGEWQTTYHFMKKDLSQELGYATIGDLEKLEKNNPSAFLSENRIMQDYPNKNISGKRIKISYAENYDDKKYGGIAELTDRLSVEYCLKKGIKPIVISEADTNSHIAHYKRGLRFFPLEKGNIDYEYFQEKYGNSDINQVIEKLLNQNHGEKIDISQWGIAKIYMPQENIEKYITQIKEKPLL